MDVFESGIFYGKKLHPSQSQQYLNADAAAVIAAPQSSVGAATGKGASPSDSSAGKTTPTTGTATGKSGTDLMNTGTVQAGAVVTDAQVTPPPAPTPSPAGPFLGTFQFPQQYNQDDYGQQQGTSNKTLLFIALGIAALGGLIYYKKHNA